MTKKEFKQLTGEDPQDMFGGDWENTVLELAQSDAGLSKKPK